MHAHMHAYENLLRTHTNTIAPTRKVEFTYSANVSGIPSRPAATEHCSAVVMGGYDALHTVPRHIDCWYLQGNGNDEGKHEFMMIMKERERERDRERERGSE